MTMGVFSIGGTSPAAPETVVVGNPVNGLDDYDALKIVASLVGATGGTLDVYLQTNDSEDGTTWTDYAHFAQLASGAAAEVVAMTVSLDGQSLTPVTVGQGLSPILASTGALGGSWGRSMRVVAKAGTGTTAGAPISIEITGQSPRPRDR